MPWAEREMQRWADTTFSTGVRLPALSVVVSSRWPLNLSIGVPLLLYDEGVVQGPFSTGEVILKSSESSRSMRASAKRLSLASVEWA
jgi:hypothetical protein